jgi:hypothetical protein
MVNQHHKSIQIFRIRFLPLKIINIPIRKWNFKSTRIYPTYIIKKSTENDIGCQQRILLRLSRWLDPAITGSGSFHRLLHSGRHPWVVQEHQKIPSNPTQLRLSDCLDHTLHPHRHRGLETATSRLGSLPHSHQNPLWCSAAPQLGLVSDFLHLPQDRPIILDHYRDGYFSLGDHLPQLGEH